MEGIMKKSSDINVSNSRVSNVSSSRVNNVVSKKKVGSMYVMPPSRPSLNPSGSGSQYDVSPQIGGGSSSLVTTVTPNAHQAGMDPSLNPLNQSMNASFVSDRQFTYNAQKYQ